MSEHPIILLAALMGVVTYAMRIGPFLLPIGRLPQDLATSLRLMGPATLASVAAVALWAPLADPGVDPVAAVALWSGTAVCVAFVAVRRNLAAGVVGALVVATLLTMLLAP